MRLIKMNNSPLCAKVDDEFYPFLARYTWSLTGFGHATTRTGILDGKNLLMHRLILNTNLEVDHIDGDGLNNQLTNLRAATRSQNCANRKKFAGVYQSQYKGVTLSRDKFRAVIKKDGVKISIGNYKTEIAAARAYDRVAQQLFGEFANLNFPIESKVKSIA